MKIEVEVWPNSYQVLELDVSVFLDRQFGVRNCFTQISSQITQHLRNNNQEVSTGSRGGRHYRFDSVEHSSALFLDLAVGFTELGKRFARLRLRLSDSDLSEYVTKS